MNNFDILLYFFKQTKKGKIITVNCWNGLKEKSFCEYKCLQIIFFADFDIFIPGNVPYPIHN